MFNASQVPARPYRGSQRQLERSTAVPCGGNHQEGRRAGLYRIDMLLLFFLHFDCVNAMAGGFCRFGGALGLAGT